MLQFLVGVRLHDCSYPIPQLRTTIQYNGVTYLVRDGGLWMYGDSVSDQMEIDVKLTPVAIMVRDSFPPLRFLSDSGKEYYVQEWIIGTGRGPECYKEYLN